MITGSDFSELWQSASLYRLYSFRGNSPIHHESLAIRQRNGRVGRGRELGEGGDVVRCGGGTLLYHKVAGEYTQKTCGSR